MSNIDDKLAFGEYVSLPIRTEKTAEEKWDELRKYINGKLDSADKSYRDYSNCQMVDEEAYWLQEICDILFNILLKMDELDT